MDANKIITSLLTAAIIFLFTSIFAFNDSVTDLSKQIAVMQEQGISNQKEWARRGRVVDNLMKSMESHAHRLDRLEWEAGK